jgi:hypothetical protein
MEETMRFPTGAIRRPLFIAALLTVTALASGCSYTQIATSPATYDEYEEPVYLPEPARGAYGQLSMWGYWMEVPGFGWVWQPDVEFDWQPYYYGHWVWTSFEWTWVSYEPFGWITYHYGYWNYDPNYGWFWIPDYYWYACGVTWIYYDDFICWAPIPPPGHHLLDPWAIYVDNVWVVVPATHFLKPHVGNYKYKGPRADPRYGSKRVFRAAPGKRLIEGRTGTRVKEVHAEVRKVRSNDHEYQRIRFPESERRVIDRYYKPTRKEKAPAAKSPEPKRKAAGPPQKAAEKKGKSDSAPGKSSGKDKSSSSGKSKKKKD